MWTMTRLAIAVAPLVLIQLPLACTADGSALGGDSGAGDFFVGDTLFGDSISSGDPQLGDSHAAGDLSGDLGLCPPTGGFGYSVGSVLPSVTLEDCDGNSHNLNELCERDAGWIFVFAGW